MFQKNQAKDSEVKGKSMRLLNTGNDAIIS